MKRHRHKIIECFGNNKTQEREEIEQFMMKRKLFNSIKYFLSYCFCMKQQLEIMKMASLAAQTHFGESEVKILYELFRKLSSSIVDDGIISKEEFQVGLFRRKKENLFADRIFHLFDSKNDGVIDFEEFVQSLSIFHPKASQAEKVIFSFQLYDIWQTGFIEREEVKEMILALLNESDLIIDDDIVEFIINKTFEEADVKKDGKIDLEEWNDFTSRDPSLLKMMTIPYLKDITAAFPSFSQRSADVEDDTDYYLTKM